MLHGQVTVPHRVMCICITDAGYHVLIVFMMQGGMHLLCNAGVHATKVARHRKLQRPLP